MANLHASAYDVCQEAMAMLREEQTLNANCILYGQDPATGAATRTPNKVENACRREYENVRHAVLDAFPWGFVKREVMVRSSQDILGRWSTAYPGVVDNRIVACYGELGDKVEWKTIGHDKIISREPIVLISYLEDVEDVTEWPRLARTALVCSLAAALAIEITGRAADADVCNRKANEAIQVARTQDARNSGTGTSVYGRNYLYDIATGKRRAKFLSGGMPW